MVQSQAAGLTGAGATLGSLAGIGVSGRIVNLTPGTGRLFVAFLVRPNTARSDLEFWADVAVRLSTRPEVRFEAYCEASACAAPPRLPPSITLLQAGEVRSSSAVLRSDERGEALLVSNQSKVIRDIRWRHAMNAARVAEAVGKLP
ncbi:MAG: hypothetical protein ACRD1M_06135 [Terriglobales bacterium]